MAEADSLPQTTTPSHLGSSPLCVRVVMPAPAVHPFLPTLSFASHSQPSVQILIKLADGVVFSTLILAHVYKFILRSASLEAKPSNS